MMILLIIRWTPDVFTLKYNLLTCQIISDEVVCWLHFPIWVPSVLVLLPHPPHLSHHITTLPFLDINYLKILFRIISIRLTQPWPKIYQQPQPRLSRVRLPLRVPTMGCMVTTGSQTGMCHPANGCKHHFESGYWIWLTDYISQESKKLCACDEHQASQWPMEHAVIVSEST